MKRHVTIFLSWVGYVIPVYLIGTHLLPNKSETQAWFFLISLVFPLMGISLYSIILEISSLDRYGDKLSFKIISVIQILLVYIANITSFGLIYIGRLKDSGEITDSIYTAYYFSIVTITTIDCSDVVPVHGIARIAAALEALLGFFFLVLLSALTVKLANFFRPR